MCDSDYYYASYDSEEYCITYNSKFYMSYLIKCLSAWPKSSRRKLSACNFHVNYI